MEAQGTGEARRGPAGQAREVVATYESYRDAEAAVDRLSDEGFPVEHVAIVGTGLRIVEQVAGRTTTLRSALAGALNGALMGALFAAFLGLFFTLEEGGFIGLLLYGLALGAIFGGLLAAMTQGMQGGRRDFTSVQGMQAERYEIQVDVEHAPRARELLAGPTAP